MDAHGPAAPNQLYKYFQRLCEEIAGARVALDPHL
jgi:hypothetical protein